MSTEEPKIGVFICHCGSNIAGVIDIPTLVEYAATLPHVTVAEDYRYMCSDPGQDLIRERAREKGLNRVVVAACSPTLHEPTFRRVLESMDSTLSSLTCPTFENTVAGFILTKKKPPSKKPKTS